jgi:hypothetical protein
MTVEQYMADVLKSAYEKFPDCGFLLYVVDGLEDGELTMLTNMDAEEVNAVHETVADPDETMELVASRTRH